MNMSQKTPKPHGPPGFRSGHVVMLGKPNVGKSTLFNALVGERISIVTEKPQTTRQNILGVDTTGKSQMLFLDTPGLLNPRYKLQAVMRRHVERALNDADVLLVILDAGEFEASFDDEVRDLLTHAGDPVVVALNKVDLVGVDQVKQQLDSIRAALPAHEALPVSGLLGSNLLQLRSRIEANLPLGPQFYPEDTMTEQPERFFVAELVREEIFCQLHQEVPYAIAVTVEQFKEDGAKVYIQSEIVVERASQKGIVIGSGGKALKAIGQNARKKIEAFLNRPVYLDLHVKVWENWRKKERALRGFGYLS